jgi:hypothetical protein
VTAAVATVLALVVAAVVVIVVVVSGSSGSETPTKDNLAAYTQAFVQQAIDRYKHDGREATIAYYNSADSVDGQWYVFIIGPDGVTIGHHNPNFRGRDPSERIDATGHFYGDDLLSADENGKWVNYVIINPETGQNQRKHTWAIRYDGLLFGSGWYEK